MNLSNVVLCRTLFPCFCNTKLAMLVTWLLSRGTHRTCKIHFPLPMSTPYISLYHHSLYPRHPQRQETRKNQKRVSQRLNAIPLHHPWPHPISSSIMTPSSSSSRPQVHPPSLPPSPHQPYMYPRHRHQTSDYTNANSAHSPRRHLHLYTPFYTHR